MKTQAEEWFHAVSRLPSMTEVEDLQAEEGWDADHYLIVRFPDGSELSEKDFEEHRP